MIICLVTGLWLLLTGIDPAKLPELGRVQRNRALPLTYLLILIVTDDSGYMGEHVNGTMLNRVGVLYLVILTIASVAAILLLVITGLAHASVPPAAIHLRAG